MSQQLYAGNIPRSRYKEDWKLVDNAWNWFGSHTRDSDGVKTTTYKCKLAKHRKSSTQRPETEGESSKKRRISSVLTPIPCPARLQVIESPGTDVVIVQMHPNFPQHENHTLADVDDQRLCSHASDIIKAEAAMPYAPKDVAAALPEIMLQKYSPARGKALGLDRVSARDVWNKRWKQRKDQPVTPASQTVDINEAIQELEGAGYQVKRFLVSATNNSVDADSDEEEDTHAGEGFAFATVKGLETLRDNSYLVLLDSTHKTNKYDLRLFTTLVRNKFGSWIPAGQFYVSVENGESVHQGLQSLRSMIAALGGKVWQPRYIQIDQSNIERNGIKKTFRGMQAGEEEVHIKWCKVLKWCTY
ncbi:hypothetical protein DFS34DRAFT_687064 [Phlyctochytrium arcticum]|nr:hypothetical protein DFS34DRAFT_687064 [Phlyctochytrium arcticum]